MSNLPTLLLGFAREWNLWISLENHGPQLGHLRTRIQLQKPNLHLDDEWNKRAKSIEFSDSAQ